MCPCNHALDSFDRRGRAVRFEKVYDMTTNGLMRCSRTQDRLLLRDRLYIIQLLYLEVTLVESAPPQDHVLKGNVIEYVHPVIAENEDLKI